jgi:preprotein translocase subunit SecD
MKKLLVPLVAFLAWAATATESSTSPVFQIRLVLDAPSADSEQMTLETKHPNIPANVFNVQRTILLDQTALKSARASTDGLGHPIIDIVFSEKGTKEFAEITRRYIGKRLAIIIDGKLYQAPVLKTEIKGGKAQISGSFSQEEANAFAKEISKALKKH